MKQSSPLAVCVGTIVGFFACCVLGRLAAHKNIYKHFARLHPNIEIETSYYPTASQLLTIARAQCSPTANKILVLIGGNSVFNGSGQRRDELWSRVLQTELGNQYQVVNFAAPGAGLMDNGGVVFEVLAREYPRAMFVTNTEPGSYLAANRSAYSYLFWDAYYKGLVPEAARLIIPNAPDDDTPSNREFKLGLWLNSIFYFDDLWNYVSYRYVSAVWFASLQSRSFLPRGHLPDWYDKRPPVVAAESEFQQQTWHIERMHQRWAAAADRFQETTDGRSVQTPESLQQDREKIGALLPDPLQHRTLIVLTPYNPWFLARLTDVERSRVSVSFQNATALLTQAGFHALSLFDGGFEPSDFGDSMHLSPAGARRLAHLVAGSIRAMNTQTDVVPER